MADRPDRSRAWGVLAVTLALMALVAALSSTTSRAPIESPAASAAHRTADPQSNGRAAGENHHGMRWRRSEPKGRRQSSSASAQMTDAGRRQAAGKEESATGTGAGGTGAGTGLATGVPSPSRAGAVGAIVDGAASAGAASAGTTAAGAPDLASGTSGRSATPTSLPTISPAASSTGAGTTPVPSPPSTAGTSSTETGAVGPGGSASFAAEGGGPVSAAATWTGATTLELGISCPDGVSAARTGTTGLSVEIDDTYGTGTCTVTLALAPGQAGTADYRVSIEPAG